MRAAGVEVFAVEDTAVQVCWRAIPEGPVVVEVGDRRAEARATGGPGGVDVTDLPPDTRLEVGVAFGGERHHVGHVHTLAPPPGPELYRFATVNDVHIGETAFGFLRTMRERSPAAAPYPERCLRAAILEAVAWGAQRLVVKGDVTDRGREHEWAVAVRALVSSGLPVDLLLGNHDMTRDSIDPGPLLHAHGIHLMRTPTAVDVPGLRIVGVPTARRSRGEGFIEAAERAETAALVGDAPGPAFVALHHYPQRFPFPTMWPPGIASPMAGPFLDAIAAANPATLVTSGHSHRHRRHRHGHHRLTVAEIGSTKDYPGAWAGYVVHEGGIRQVVRRIAAPDAIEWTEYTRRALLGGWGRWSPGLRSHRCFTMAWPARPVPPGL